MTVGQERALLARLLRESVLTLCRKTMTSHRRLVVDGIVLVSLEDDDDDIDNDIDDDDGGEAGKGGEGAGPGRSGGRRASGDDDKSPLVVTIHEQLPKLGESRGAAAGVDAASDSPNFLRTILRARKRSRSCSSSQDGEFRDYWNGPRSIPSRRSNRDPNVVGTPREGVAAGRRVDEQGRYICVSNNDDNSNNISSRNFISTSGCTTTTIPTTTTTSSSVSSNNADDSNGREEEEAEPDSEMKKEEKRKIQRIMTQDGLWLLESPRARHAGAQAAAAAPASWFPAPPPPPRWIVDEPTTRVSAGDGDSRREEGEAATMAEREREEEPKVMELGATLPAEDRNLILRSPGEAEEMTTATMMMMAAMMSGTSPPRSLHPHSPPRATLHHHHHHRDAAAASSSYSDSSVPPPPASFLSSLRLSGPRWPGTAPSVPSPRGAAGDRPPPCKLRRPGQEKEEQEEDEEVEEKSRGGAALLEYPRDSANRLRPSSQDGRWSDPTPLNLATMRSTSTSSDSDSRSERNPTGQGVVRAWDAAAAAAVDLSLLWKNCRISDYTGSDNKSSGGGSNSRGCGKREAAGRAAGWTALSRESAPDGGDRNVGGLRGGSGRRRMRRKSEGFRCTRCGLRVADLLSLERHHLREHACFTCHVCLATFTARNNLKRHARVHTGYRPYECPTCRAAFFRRDDFKTHCQRHVNRSNANGAARINNDYNTGLVASPSGAPAAISVDNNTNSHNGHDDRWHLTSRLRRKNGQRRDLSEHDAEDLSRPLPDRTDRHEATVDGVEDAEHSVVAGEGEDQDGGGHCPEQQSSWCTECQRGFPDEEALIRHITRTHESGFVLPRDPQLLHQHRPAHSAEDDEEDDADHRRSKPPGPTDLSGSKKGTVGALGGLRDEDTPMESEVTDAGDSEAKKKAGGRKSEDGSDVDTKHHNELDQLHPTSASAQRGESNGINNDSNSNSSSSSSTRREGVPKGPPTRPCEGRTDLVNDDEKTRWISHDATSGTAAAGLARRCASASPSPSSHSRSHSSSSSHHPSQDSRLRALLSTTRFGGRFRREVSDSCRSPDRTATPPSFIRLVRPHDFVVERNHGGPDSKLSSPSELPAADGLAVNTFAAASSVPFLTPLAVYCSPARPGDSPPAAHAHNNNNNNVRHGGSTVPRCVDNFLHVETSFPSWSSPSNALNDHFSRRLNDCWLTRRSPPTSAAPSDGRSSVKQEPMSDAEEGEEGEGGAARRVYRDRHSSSDASGRVCLSRSCSDCCPPPLFRSQLPSAMKPISSSSSSSRDGSGFGCFAPPPLSPTLPTDLSMNRRSSSSSSSSPSGSSPRSGSSVRSNNNNGSVSVSGGGSDTGSVKTDAAMTAGKPTSFEKVVTPKVLYRDRSPFRCVVADCADLLFAEFGQLEDHCARLHRRYLCQYCGKSFTAKPNRDRHVRYHTGHRPYKCQLCSQAFYRGDDLKYHRTTKHTGLALHEQGLAMF